MFQRQVIVSIALIFTLFGWGEAVPAGRLTTGSQVLALDPAAASFLLSQSQPQQQSDSNTTPTDMQVINQYQPTDEERLASLLRMYLQNTQSKRSRVSPINQSEGSRPQAMPAAGGDTGVKRKRLAPSPRTMTALLSSIQEATGWSPVLPWGSSSGGGGSSRLGSGRAFSRSTNGLIGEDYQENGQEKRQAAAALRQCYFNPISCFKK